ncbi:indole-3-glycerol phosphate synthase TrpC [Acaryochloris marina]|uniref:Indole-3-glycerol phosphate synthase n=1 Tax=Acaryochloris marina (strain MBIC 11017) TaxID=329726 RepID=TRPC_ACAM1|nr:indole-3-glycerol phosphate synthase TrpC [Acaryochloris marina]B0CEU2.1 RecName: Full=Indole-3-glycerol phosphate synthase; Short=IGPS [Acaryochloris marina MBIC11017]ABW29339.1 indole-3-glycerol phosphate synthase [Acaryochloris marina MBIC11017]BDM78259.1 indole-3-glycerol phosphate synthase [Acaryochloris marina MBIC10699]
MQIRRRPPSVAVNVQELQYQVKTPENEPRNILEKIVWFKETEVEQMRDSVSLLDLRKQVANCEPPLSFLDALKHGKTQPALIAEVKKASPSKGVLRENFDPVAIAQAYEAAGASCLSVLTDAEFFQGSFDYLQQIRAAVSLPLLCKEFVIYPYQIYLARSRGADAVLLIAAILSDQDLTYFLKIIKSLGMTALVEVHTLPELERVMDIPGIELIGINNRDLETFTVDLEVTCQLLAQQGTSLQDQDILVVSESGLHTSADLAQVKQAGAGAVLIGESLVKETGNASTHSETEQMQAKISALFS